MDFHSLLAEKFCMSCLLFLCFLCVFFCVFLTDFFMNTISVNSLHQDHISNIFKYNEKSF